jgi:hypothetical protein
VAISCEQETEPSDSIQGGIFLHRLNISQFLKKTLGFCSVRPFLSLLLMTGIVASAGVAGRTRVVTWPLTLKSVSK